MSENRSGPSKVSKVSQASKAFKGTRAALILFVVYLVECVLLKLTADNRGDTDASIVIGGFSTVFGAVMTALALQTDYVAALRLRWRLRHDAVAVPATVAAVLSFHGSDFTYPVYEYTTPDGATHRHADASSRSLAVGATADVRYRPADADHAVGPLGGFNAVAFAVLGVFGGVFTVIMPILTVQSIIT